MSAVLQEAPIPEKLTAALVVTDDIRTQLESGKSAEKTAIAEAGAFEIDSNEMAEIVTQECVGLAQRIDQLKALQKKFVQPAKDIIETANNLFNPAIISLDRARQIKLGRVKDWMQQEQLRIQRENAERQEAERKARQEAEQKAAAERARAEEQAAIERRRAEEAETKRRQAEAEGNNRAAAAAAAESAKAQERANAALENGAARAEQAALEAAAVSIAAHVPVAVKPSGATLRDNWIAELAPGLTEDQAKAAIAAACAERPELLAYLKLDMSAIHKASKAQKQHMNIPGFKPKNDQQIAGRRK